MMQGAQADRREPPTGRDSAARRGGGDPPAADPAADGWQALEPALVKALVAKLLAGRPGQPAYRPNPALLPFTDFLEAVDGRPGRLATAARRLPPGCRRAAGVCRSRRGRRPPRPGSMASTPPVWPSGSTCVAIAPLLHELPGLAGAARPVHLVAALAGPSCSTPSPSGMRIWLTGRPPVVNLYSSAVFIGWACVLAGLVLERLYRLGIGNLVAAISGGLTLGVAYGLDSGDTMHVLQAVLDTQFWLSTHVVTVTLGYGATFLAGLLGTCAIVHRIWTELAGHGRRPGRPRHSRTGSTG